MKMKNERLSVFRFSFFMKMKTEWRALKTQSKNLLNMKIVINYLNFVFHVVVKTISKDKILNFVLNLSKTRNGTLGTRFYLYSNI